MTTAIDSVGDWDGQETLAATQIEKIYTAIDELGGDEEAKKRAWDDWGSDQKLLVLSDEDITEYVNEIT